MGRSRPAADRDDALQALSRILLASDPGAARIRSRTRDIGRRLLRESLHVREPDFTKVHVDDLRLLFAAYDDRFLNGLCGDVLGPEGLTFRLSSRMTRAGGKTTRFHRPDGTRRYEIAVGTSILFDGFLAHDRAVTVAGLRCGDRLEALQRVFEHELVHLAEWLCWDASHCGRKRFQGIAARLFGHRSHTHRLITRVERAAGLGLTPGARVTFRHRGRRLHGRINRITKRATVLVADPAGKLWSDGRRYVRYYVPLGRLTAAPADPRTPPDTPH